MAESPHSPGTTTQLSGARSTAELIARRAVLPPGPAMSKARETPSPSFLFSPPCRHAGRAWGRQKVDPINLFRPRIISPGDWSYKLLPHFGCKAMSNHIPQKASALPEKEVIQPHLPVRLPCYDFTPVTSPAFGTPLLAVKVTTSGMASSHSVTGGVYKARERIHRRMADRRLLAIPASCKRVAACNPN